MQYMYNMHDNKHNTHNMQIFNKNWPDSKSKQKLELLLSLLLNTIK